MPPSNGRRNIVKVGPISARWYKCGDDRTQVDLRKYGRGVRAFASHSEALRYLETVLEEIVESGASVPELTRTDRAAWSIAVSSCRQRGISFSDMVAEWSEARRVVDLAGKSLGEVVAAGLSVLVGSDQTAAEVVRELLQSKEAHALHRRYLRGLRSTGELLASRFPGPLRNVSAHDLEEMLDGSFSSTGERVGGLRDRNGRQLAPRTRNNVLRQLRQIFRFAVARGYLRADVPTAAARVPAIRRVRPRVGIVSPFALRLYLKHCSAAFLPWLAINSFSGVRPEEIVLSKDAPAGKDALRWSDFDWNEREIVVRAEVSKTGTARRCPIADNLFAWLQPWRDAKASGLVVPPIEGRQPRPDHERARFVELAQREACEIARKAGELVPFNVSYPANGLRHSYCSFRIALTRNLEAVAYEAGDSVAMQKRHYNNPRPISEAREWFAIFPDCRPANVVTFAA